MRQDHWNEMLSNMLCLTEERQTIQSLSEIILSCYFDLHLTAALKPLKHLWPQHFSITCLPLLQIHSGPTFAILGQYVSSSKSLPVSVFSRSPTGAFQEKLTHKHPFLSGLLVGTSFMFIVGIFIYISYSYYTFFKREEQLAYLKDFLLL